MRRRPKAIPRWCYNVEAKTSRRPGRRAYLLACLFALLLVIFPFLFWYSTWFGRKLTAAEIDGYLKDAASKPRKAQHALVQLGERMTHGDTHAARWYPDVIRLSSSPSLELRQTAAWIMGQDSRYGPFHEALQKLLRDPEPMVRRNAALALSNFGDASARPELRAMLRPYTIRSPVGGVVKYRLKLGDFVNPGTLVARIGEIEVRAPLPGEVRALTQKEGAGVQPGAVLAEIGADKDHAWEALRALFRVGQPDDLDDVRRYLRAASGMTDRLRQQAAFTIDEIENRRKQP